MGRFGAGLLTAFLSLFSFAVAAHSATPVEQIKLSGYGGVQLIRGPQNHLLMPARVNGKPASFLLDTGANLSFLRADRAQELGVHPLGQETRSSGRSFPLGVVGDLRAGGAALGPSTVALYQTSQLGGPVPGEKGKPADGALGLDLLRRQRAIINCRTRQIFFKTNPSRGLNLLAATRGRGFTRVPIEENSGGYLTIPCTIKGRSGRLILDTGAFLTSLDNDAARDLALNGSSSGATARGYDGRVRPLAVAQVDDLKLGGLPLPPQKLLVMDVFGAKKPTRTFTGINRIEYYAARPRLLGQGTLFGLLGNELLDLHQAIIDLDSMSLFLK